jgi:hypothetical protein
MEKPGSIKMTLRHGAAALLLLGIFVLSSGVQASAGRQENAEARVDYASMQQDILKFEAAVDEAVNSTFSASSFAVVQRAKGAYLQGYGISCAFLVNLHRAVIRTPFGDVRRGDSTPDLKKRRIEELKEKLIGVLQDGGETFRQLRKDDCVTIVAYVEDRNFPDEPSANKTILLSALKRDLDELGHRNDRLREFKQRMKTVEY